jgi:hypothetical protein
MSVKRVERVDLHIGPPKSGTTFLQNVLFANKSQLLSDGVVLPRQDPRGMWRSVSHLLHRDPRADSRASSGTGWCPTSSPPGRAECCCRSTAVVRRSGCGVGAARAASRPPRSHVSLHRARPGPGAAGSWQTRLRNRKSPTWQEFCVGAGAGCPSRYGANFWRAQDPELALAPWRRPSRRADPPRHRATARLTARRCGERFCARVGLQPERYSLDVPRSNQSLAASRPR